MADFKLGYFIMYNLKLFYFTAKIIGICVPQGTIYPVFIVQMITI
jgi:hypothetical protein